MVTSNNSWHTAVIILVEVELSGLRRRGRLQRGSAEAVGWLAEC